MSLGEQIKKLRKEKGIFQEELADKLNLSRTAISGYEINTREPSLQTLKKICVFFGVSADELLEIDTKEQKEEILNEINQYNNNKR
ncbi:MAG: helix-turn-helix transcriptional regulator [Clostridia bacterium]|nr:helix-turn-helix transcriptional regulator [Clostridia bacterium]